MVWYITPWMLSATKGDVPVSISYSTTPSENTSERLSARLPETCSGDMYLGEPRIMPVMVLTSLLRMRAMPKSVIFTSAVVEHHDVRGLDVAMDDLAIVRVLQAFRDLRGDVERLRKRDRRARLQQARAVPVPSRNSIAM